MTDYRQMYLMLFNSITDALENMDRQNYGFARDALKRAQQETEAIFMASDGE